KRQRLFSDGYVCMVGGKYPVEQNELTLQQYLQAPHAVYRPVGGSHSFVEDVIDRVFSEHGAQRRIVLQVTHGLGIPEIVADTDLVIAVPRSLAELYADHLNIRVLPLPFPSPEVEISQQWHERFQHDSGHAWLRSTFVQLFRV